MNFDLKDRSIMAKEPLKKPVQETGSNNQTVKDLPHARSEFSTTKKLTTIKLLKIVGDNGEAPPVEENYNLPKERAASSGVGDGHPPINKVSVETQTDAELPEKRAEVKPEPEVEKESDIKEMSTQTLLEEKHQLSLGRHIKGKRKKQRSKKKRPSKESIEVSLIPSSDDTQRRSILFQFPGMSGNVMVVYSLLLLWFFCFVGVTHSFPVKEECHVYSAVAQFSLVNAKLDIQKGIKPLCEISVNMSQKKVFCDVGSSVRLINETLLYLITKEKNNNYHVEAGDMKTFKFEYEDTCQDIFGDQESALKHVDPEGAQTTPFVLTESLPVQHTNDGMPLWQIIFIILGAILGSGVIVAVVLFVFRDRLCKRKEPLPENATEMEPLGNAQERNGPEHPANV